ncbi:MAG: biosynthetic arginine decarboxylase [Verrucomicrobiota bacterium]|nr:biosynthetic arginine decarboxylase [Verrucomicrobiota bacterium]
MQASTKRGPNYDWGILDSEHYYGLKHWGLGYFSIDSEGFLEVSPRRGCRSIRIHEIVLKALSQGHTLPLTIRIQDLLSTRVEELNEQFNLAIKEEGYNGRYRGVFPIKVNQLREVVEEIQAAGKPYHFGLECGSKPELMIALAMHNDKQSLIICNGYKDGSFIRLALTGRLMSKEIYLVVEQLSEIPLIIEISREMGVQPLIGFRIKLSSAGEGKWASSSGDNAKFGLSSSEVMEAVRMLKSSSLENCLRLIHFHIGSQVPNIQTIKKSTVEATRFYCELSKLGFPMELIDVGGGLGIDYNGSSSNHESSMNYTQLEYVRDIVYNIKSVCVTAGVTVPDIISESGRAIVAPHSILVTNVFDRISKSTNLNISAEDKLGNLLLQEFESILNNTHNSSLLERYHDAQQKSEEANNLFNDGFLSLGDKADADANYWKICQELLQLAKKESCTPVGLESLPAQIAEKYVCNFSIFQSLMDHWACHQLFPIVPLHRLNEAPEVEATLVDVTCDSEGKIDTFTDIEDERSTLRLHKLKDQEPYYLGFFMVGAYQDIMGDFHNLFGKVDEVHVCLADDKLDGFCIENSINGSTINDVLCFTQYDGQHLSQLIKKQLDLAIKAEQIKPHVGTSLLAQYNKSLKSSTYLGT